ncbi:MAG: GNAT family N-acetyltransferase [Anaerolineales bacterium]|nr:GNAT family N-acetyltransferase [Anaerolineales bacterium]
MIDIRPVTVADAAALLALAQRLDQESRFMMLEPAERQTSLAEQTAQLTTLLAQPNQMIFVAAAGDQLVGYLGAQGGVFRRNRHSAELVIGILAAYAGQGIGTRLFAALLAWAPTVGLSRLELTVMVHNSRAIALYEKMGFVSEGSKRHSLRVDGHYVDEYYMARLLD